MEGTTCFLYEWINIDKVGVSRVSFVWIYSYLRRFSLLSNAVSYAPDLSSLLANYRFKWEFTGLWCHNCFPGNMWFTILHLGQERRSHRPSPFTAAGAVWLFLCFWRLIKRLNYLQGEKKNAANHVFSSGLRLKAIIHCAIFQAMKILKSPV